MTKQQQSIIDHKLNEGQRRYVLPRYESRKKSKLVAYLTWFFFGVYYFYLGKPIANLLLWISFPFLIGIVWWFVDLFRIPGIVDEYNDKLLMSLIAEAKTII